MAKIYVEPEADQSQHEQVQPVGLIRSGNLSSALTGASVAISLFVVLMLATELLSMAGLSLVNRLAFKNEQAKYVHLAFYRNKPWASESWKEYFQAQHYDFKPYVAWRKSAFVGRYVNVDADGIRRTVNSDCSPSSRRIWMFGASTLWGMGSRDQDTISSILAEKYSKSVGPVCITNFGEGGWVSMQEIIELELALKRISSRPDLVLFYDGFADASAPYFTGRVDVPTDFDQLRRKASQDDRQPSSAFLKATNTYRLVQFFMDQLLKVKQDQTATSMPSEHQLDLYASMAAENYLQNVRLIQSLSEQYGFRYAILWQPLIYEGNKPLDLYERQIRETAVRAAPGLPLLYRKVTDLVVSAGNPHFVSLIDVFDHCPEEIFIDYGHTNPIGNRLIAERMLEAIRGPRTGLVP